LEKTKAAETIRFGEDKSSDLIKITEPTKQLPKDTTTVPTEDVTMSEATSGKDNASTNEEITGSSGLTLATESTEVAELQGITTRNKVVFYKVRYVDGTVAWEPEDALSCPDLQREFHASKGTWCPICGKLTLTKTALVTHTNNEHRNKKKII
jgi:hypothetical protein